MQKKKLYNTGNIVYSTAPDFKAEYEEKDDDETAPPAEQALKIILDKKHRAGKVVSLITGFEMKDSEIEDLAKQLKSLCGSGGSVKDKEIIIQGDHRDKMLQWLLKKGYTKTRKI